MSAPIVITPIAFSVHRRGESPIYGEQTTRVTVDDEGGGPFVVISQMHDHIEPGKVSLDFDELQAVLTATQALRIAHEGAV